MPVTQARQCRDEWSLRAPWQLAEQKWFPFHTVREFVSRKWSGESERGRHLMFFNVLFWPLQVGTWEGAWVYLEAMARREGPYLNLQPVLGLGSLQVGGAPVRLREQESGRGLGSEVVWAWSVDPCVLVLQWVGAGLAAARAVRDHARLGTYLQHW